MTTTSKELWGIATLLEAKAREAINSGDMEAEERHRLNARSARNAARLAECRERQSSGQANESVSMTTTAEHIAAIRKAIDAGPTPGEWHEGHLGQAGKCQCRSIVNEDYAGGIATVHLDNSKPISDGGNGCPPLGEAVANMALIASCNPVAMTAVLAEIDRLKAENERMQRLLGSLDWYWPEDDTSSDACADGPWQIAENCDVLTGEVFGYSRGGVVETRYYGFLEAAEDAGTDDRFEVDEPTREAAEAKINAELHRRAALKGDAHGN